MWGEKREGNMIKERPEEEKVYKMNLSLSLLSHLIYKIKTKTKRERLNDTKLTLELCSPTHPPPSVPLLKNRFFFI